MVERLSGGEARKVNAYETGFFICVFPLGFVHRLDFVHRLPVN